MAAAKAARGDGTAFDLPGRPGGSDAALLLHGLTGTPFEVRPVADRLSRAGVRCLAPLLPGHESPEALARTTWRDWVDGARRGLAALGETRRTMVVGSSMGGLVACVLAAENPGLVDGVALLAPALELQPLGKLAGWLARHTPVARIFPAVSKGGGSDVSDPVARAANPCLDAIPFHAVAELLDLQVHVEALLPRVRCPALVIAGALDGTVTAAGARRMSGRMGGGARFVLLSRSRHLVGIDVERERVAADIQFFFDSIPVRSGARATEAAR
ncbi:MAG: alpha/beta fold hydrolase [Deltaproteobacteria bacterium]